MGISWGSKWLENENAVALKIRVAKKQSGSGGGSSWTSVGPVLWRRNHEKQQTTKEIHSMRDTDFRTENERWGKTADSKYLLVWAPGLRIDILSRGALKLLCDFDENASDCAPKQATNWRRGGGGVEVGAGWCRARGVWEEKKTEGGWGAGQDQKKHEEAAGEQRYAQTKLGKAWH